MRIGVISDTHRYIAVIKKAIEAFYNPDLVIHLGDNVQDVNIIEKLYRGKIINVSGNCDFSVSVPSERVEIIEGKRFFITHGHRYDVKHGISRLKYKAMELDADVVLFGHTHISKIAYDDGIWFINPGSPYLSRDGVNSVAVIDVKNGMIIPSITRI
ncbi:metallophosphoesterase [Clostridium sp. LBM24168]